MFLAVPRLYLCDVSLCIVNSVISSCDKTLYAFIIILRSGKVAEWLFYFEKAVRDVFVRLACSI